jgi:hypothetical protein
VTQTTAADRAAAFYEMYRKLLDRAAVVEPNPQASARAEEPAAEPAPTAPVTRVSGYF